MSEAAVESSMMWSAGVAGDIVALLRACAATVESTGPSEWHLIGIDKSAIAARIESGWLVLRKPIPCQPDGTAAPAWDFLRRNAGLAGGAKYSFVSSGGSVELRAEIPLDGDVEARVRQACRLMWAEDARAAEVSAESGGVFADLEQLCGDAGWSYAARPDGSLAVELRAPDTYGVAHVACGASGAVQVSLAVVNAAEAVSPLCRAALGAFMVRVNEVVRFARVVALPSGDESTLRLEVVFATPPSAIELDHALAALSVAWGMCGSEAEVLLRDEVVAQAVLERSPWSMVPGP